MSEWHYAHGGQRRGPVSLDDLKSLAARGELSPEDLVWTTGMADWQPARTVPQLSDPTAPPTAPPSQSVASSQPVAPAVGVLSYSMPQMDALQMTPHALEMLRQTRPWVRLISILMWIGAAFVLLAGMFFVVAGSSSFRGGAPPRILGVVYLAMAILYIMPALYLSRYATKITELVRLQRSDVLEQALEAQKSFWKFVGMCFLIMVALWILSFVAAIGIGIFVR